MIHLTLCILFSLISYIIAASPNLRPSAADQAAKLLDKLNKMLSRSDMRAQAAILADGDPAPAEGYGDDKILGLNIYVFGGIIVAVVALFGFIIYKYKTWIPKKRTVTKSSPASPEQQRLVSPTK